MISLKKILASMESSTRILLLAGALAITPNLTSCASAHYKESSYDLRASTHKYVLPDEDDIETFLNYRCGTMGILIREEFQKGLKKGILFQKGTLDHYCENGIYRIGKTICPPHGPRQYLNEEKLKSILENVQKESRN